MSQLASLVISELPIFVQIILMTVIVMMGASLGSFIAACVYRVTKSHESIFLARSGCDHCGRKLGVIDLVPLFSYILLCGKCRTCKKPIPSRYFWTEIVSAVIVALLIYTGGFTLGALSKIVASLVLFSILLIDFDSWLIPTPLSLFLIAWGFLFGLVSPNGFPLVERAIGAVSGFVVFAAILLSSTWIFRRTHRLKKDEWAMGWGDPILMAGIGALVGYRFLVVVVWLASIQAIAAYLYLKLRRRDFAVLAEEAHAEQAFLPPEHALPLGTFLCLAGIEVLITASLLGI